MFRADSILFMLAGVLGLWGLSLVVRGVWGDRGGGRRRCPGCEKDVAEGVMRCGGCGFESRRGLDFRAAKRHWGMVVAGTVVTFLSPGVFMAGIGVRRWSYSGGDYRAIQESGPWAMLALGMIAFGVVVVVRGLYGRRPLGKRRCPKCWYDMEGAPTLVCPECGHDSKVSRNLYRRQRCPALVWAGALVVLAGAAVLVIPAVRKDSWWSLVPTPVFIAGMETVPSRALLPWDHILERRLRDGSLWDWERSWLRSKCVHIANTSTDSLMLRRMIRITTGDTDYWEALHARALRGITDPSLKVRTDTAALLLIYTFWYFEPPPTIHAAIISSKERLLELASSDAGAVGDAAIALLHWADDEPDAITSRLLGFVKAGDTTLHSDLAVSGLYVLALHHQAVRGPLLVELESSDRARRIGAFIALGGVGHPGDSGMCIGSGGLGRSPEEDIASVATFRDRLDNMHAFIPPKGRSLPSLDDVLRPRSRAFRADVIAPWVLGVIQGLDSADANVRYSAALHLAWIAAETDIDLSGAVARLRVIAGDSDQAIGGLAARALEAIEKREPRKP